MEDGRVDTSRIHLEQFLQSLTDFKTPVETISELAKHEKVDGRGSWTEAEMESELLYGVQLYLTHLDCPLEYKIPCARAVVNDILDGNFRVEDFHTSPPQLVRIDTINAEEESTASAENGHGPSGDSLEETLDGKNIQKEKVNVLSAKNLYQHAIVKANELLARWKNDVPNIEPVRLPHAISIHAMKNKRPGMEDRHVVIPDLRAVVDVKGIKSPVSFYAVYDGHAGTVAATYAAAHLHQRLCGSRNYPDHMEEALREAFVSTDDLYMIKGVRDRDSSGTTAVVSIIYQKKLYVAWVGDSEAAIVHDGQADRLVEPRHTAEHEGERKRVESEGGSVIHHQGGYRVAAVLTVTRAIGDSGLKPFVTSRPDIRVIELVGSEDYLILACDGLWDEMTPESAMKETNAYLLKNPDSINGVAKALAEKARRSGSLDNITVIVVFLKPIEQLLKELASRPAEVSSEGVDQMASFSNSLEEDFSVEFDPAAQNPFDTTPLDSSVLGDFGTPSDRSASEIDWDFQRVPPLTFNEEESHALNVLDQVIEGAAETDSPAPTRQLISFDNGSPDPFQIQTGSRLENDRRLQTDNSSQLGDTQGSAQNILDLSSANDPSGHLVDSSEGSRITSTPAGNSRNSLGISENVFPEHLQSSQQFPGPISTGLNEQSAKDGVEGVSNGVGRIKLRSEPNSGSEPLPSATSVSKAPAAKVDSTKSARIPAGKSPNPGKNIKSDEKAKAAMKSPATSSSTTPKPSTAKATPRGTPTTTSAKNTTVAPPDELKKTPARNTTTPVQKTDAKTPRVDPAKKTTSPAGVAAAGVAAAGVAAAGVPKSAKPPAAKIDVSGVAVGSRLPSRTPPTKTPPTKSTVALSSKLTGGTPDGAVDATDKLIPPTATPRSTPVAHKRSVLPVKSTSAGGTTALNEKAGSSGEASIVKTNGGLGTARTGDVKKSGLVSSRTATPAVKARPAATPRGAAKAVAEGTAPRAPASDHNGATGSETPKSKPTTSPSEAMKTPAVPPLRQKMEASTKRTPVAVATPRTAIGTPRPKPATDSVSKTLANGDRPPPLAARSKPSGLASTPSSAPAKKGVASSAKATTAATEKKNLVKPTGSINQSTAQSNGSVNQKSVPRTGPINKSTINGSAEHVEKGKSSLDPEVAEFLLTSTDSNGAVETVVLNGNGQVHEANRLEEAGLSERNFSVADSTAARNDENAISL